MSYHWSQLGLGNPGAPATARREGLASLEPPQEVAPAPRRASSYAEEPDYIFVLDPPTPGLERPALHPLTAMVIGIGGIWLLGKVLKLFFPPREANPERVFTMREAREIGKLIGIDWKTAKFPVDQFRRGLAVELEHGPHDPRTDVAGEDLAIVGKIAWAHLNELPDYYTRLEEMECEGEAAWEGRSNPLPAPSKHWRFGEHPFYPGHNIFGIFLPKTKELIGAVALSDSGWSAHNTDGVLLGGGFDRPDRAAWHVYGTYLNKLEEERRTHPGFAANPIGHRWGDYYRSNEAALRCPLEEWYGGMPSCGDFERNTEYEIGASRIAEAAHCILGSLEKGLSRFESQQQLGTSLEEAMSVEREHIVEEMQIIDKCMLEYSRQLYNERILPRNIVTESWLREEYRDNALMYSQRSVEHIRTNAPRIKALVEAKMAALESCAGLPAYVLDLAYSSYQVIRQLASQMAKSVEYYPDRVDNAYRSQALIADVSVLRGAVQRFLKATKGLSHAGAALETPVKVW